MLSMLLVGPDWTKLVAEDKALAYGVPFTDEQWALLDGEHNALVRKGMIRKWRKAYEEQREEESILSPKEVKKLDDDVEVVISKPSKKSAKKDKE